MATITAPVDGFTGRVAGVNFVDGTATATDPRALAYFRRHGYQVDRAVTSAAAPPAATEATTAPSAESTAREIRAYAEAKGIDLDGASRKADMLEAIAAAEGGEQA